jgi:short-subunit dehydrogenase
VNQLGDWLEQERIAVDFLINNAGSGDRGTVATSDPTRVLEMLEVNVVTLTMLTRRLLPAMIARKRGAILNVSSSASFMPMPGFAIYAASKAYVTSFSEALRGELRSSGVTVTALCPGPVRTEFNSVAQRSDHWEEEVPPFVYVDVADVVRVALEAIENERAVIIPGLAMKLGMFLVRLTPMPIMRLAWRFAR